jgi:hypothetical protein
MECSLRTWRCTPESAWIIPARVDHLVRIQYAVTLPPDAISQVDFQNRIPPSAIPLDDEDEANSHVMIAVDGHKLA